MSKTASNKLILVASPRFGGQSERLANYLFESYSSENSADSIVVACISALPVSNCLGCGSCAEGEGCAIEDNMHDWCAMIDDADEIMVVSPVYFAGPPAPYKALLDRLQVYYYNYKMNDNGLAPKRPLTLFVLGDGGDPHGFEPLVVCTRSAFAIAGFRLGKVFNGVGLYDEKLQDLALNPENYEYQSASGGTNGE